MVRGFRARVPVRAGVYPRARLGIWPECRGGGCRFPLSKFGWLRLRKKIEEQADLINARRIAGIDLSWCVR